MDSFRRSCNLSMDSSIHLIYTSNSSNYTNQDPFILIVINYIIINTLNSIFSNTYYSKFVNNLLIFHKLRHSSIWNIFEGFYIFNWTNHRWIQHQLFHSLKFILYLKTKFQLNHLDFFSIFLKYLVLTKESHFWLWCTNDKVNLLSQ